MIIKILTALFILIICLFCTKDTIKYFKQKVYSKVIIGSIFILYFIYSIYRIFL